MINFSLVWKVVTEASALRTNHLQNEVNKCELEKIKKEKEKAKKSIIDVKFSGTEGNYRLIFTNVGLANVCNVTANVNKDSGIDFEGYKMPYKLLRAGDSFSEPLLLFIASNPVFEVTTTWEDENGNKNTDVKKLSTN